MFNKKSELNADLCRGPVFGRVSFNDYSRSICTDFLVT